MLEYETMVQMIREHYLELDRMIDNIPTEMLEFVQKVKSLPFVVNFVIQNLPVEVVSKMEILQEPSELECAVKLLKLLKALIKLARLKRDIEHKTRMDLDKQQREYYLNQEMRNIQAELGNSDDFGNASQDYSKLHIESLMKKWPKEVGNTFKKELSRLNRINPQSPDYNVQLNYLQTMLQLPWDSVTKDNLNLNTAEKVLNADHYGMEKVKERILEHLAVLKLRHDQKSPIICLYGPPGVGKTSLGKSIAASLKRKYVRVSLGGLHDES